MGSWDLSLFRALNGLAGHVPWLDSLVSAMVNDYLVPTLLALGLFGAWFAPTLASARERAQRRVLASVAGIGAANLVTKILNALFDRPRPFEAHEVTVLFYQPTDPSFPSNQASVGFALALGLALIDRRLGAVAFVLAILWPLARIYAGVSYPFDALAGAAIGLGGTAFGLWLIRRLEPLPSRFLQQCRRWHLA